VVSWAGEVTAAEELPAADEAPEPELAAQRAWVAGRTLSVVIVRSKHIPFHDNPQIHNVLRATSAPHLEMTQEVAWFWTALKSLQMQT
jgi:hypothetical protein